MLLEELPINSILFLIGMTAEDLESSIEGWLKTKYNLEVDYSAVPPVKQLEDLGLLSREVVGRVKKFLDGIREYDLSANAWLLTFDFSFCSNPS